MTVLGIDLAEGSEGPLIALRGELDIASAPDLARAIEAELDASERPVTVDLRGLEFIDSSGLRVLIAADASARERGRKLVIVRGIPRVHRTFEVTRVDEHLTMVDAPAT
jgi:anti-sigma B factor antagonist